MSIDLETIPLPSYLMDDGYVSIRFNSWQEWNLHRCPAEFETSWKGNELGDRHTDLYQTTTYHQRSTDLFISYQHTPQSIIVLTATTGNFEEGVADAGFTTLIVKPAFIHSANVDSPEWQKDLTVFVIREQSRECFVHNVVYNFSRKTLKNWQRKFLLRARWSIAGRIYGPVVGRDRLRESKS